MREETLVKLAKQAPKNTAKWPKVYVPLNCELVFKPYGSKGRGFYIIFKQSIDNSG